MGKIKKYGENASPFVKKEKKKRKIPLTREEKEYRIDHAEKKVKEHKRLYGNQLTPNINPVLCEHEETIIFGNKLTCRHCMEIING